MWRKHRWSASHHQPRFDVVWTVASSPVLALENVRGVTGQMPTLKSVGHRSFIHERASRRVDQVCARFHHGDGGDVEDPLGARGQRQRQDDVIRDLKIASKEVGSTE